MMADAHTEEKRKGLKRCRQMGGHSRLFLRAWIMVLAMTVLSVMNAGVTLADNQSLPVTPSGYQAGTVTAIYERAFQIDGATYSFTPDAVILDDRGVEREPAAIRITSYVQFHVQKGERDKIDRMILYLPQ